MDAARQNVWLVMSELFLDTELDEAQLKHIEHELSVSGFSADQLDTMFHEDVAPVCLPNLRAVAGVWSGFDTDWLSAEIERNQQKPMMFRSVKTRLRARTVRRMVPEWTAILAGLAGKDLG